MSAAPPLEPGDSAKPSIIRHAGRRWEVLPGAEEIVRGRDDWTMKTLREEFADSVLHDRRDRFVFKAKVAGRDVAVKVEKAIGYKVKVRSVYGRCKVRKEWENHLVAIDCGIPTVRPLALGEIRKRLIVREALIITEWEPGAIMVKEWRRKNIDRAGSDEALKVAADIGRISALTQESGLYHNEIQTRNIVVKDTADGARVLLLDWKHARIKRRTTENDLQNMRRTVSLFDRQLSFAPLTEAEREAFLTAYLEATAHRPDRARFVAELRESCPQAERIYRALRG